MVRHIFRMPSRLDDYEKYTEDTETSHLWQQVVVVRVVEEELEERGELKEV